MDEEKKETIEVEQTENTDTEKVEQTKPTIQTQPTEEPKKNRKGFCITSMVLGIIAMVFFCLWYISIPCGILSIIFGILGVKSTNKGMAIAGIVTGAIGLVISIFIIVMIFIFGMAVGISDVLDDYDDYSHHQSFDKYDWDWYDYD